MPGCKEVVLLLQLQPCEAQSSIGIQLGTRTLFFFLSLLFYSCILNLPTYYSEHPFLLFSNFLGTRLLVDEWGRILEHFEQTKHVVYQAWCLTLLSLASNYESDVLVGRW